MTRSSSAKAATVILLLVFAVASQILPIYASGQSIGGNSCTLSVLEHGTDAPSRTVNIQKGVDFALSSAEFKARANGFRASFIGANDGWSFDSNCRVNLTGIAINFLLVSANGTRFVFTVTESVNENSVLGLSTIPAISEAISPACLYTARIPVRDR